MGKHEKIVALSKKKTLDCRRRALETIKALETNGEKVTFYKVEKRGNVSKGFLYRDPIVSQLIREKRQ